MLNIILKIDEITLEIRLKSTNLAHVNYYKHDQSKVNKLVLNKFII